jgi:DNA polymerase III subunit epsilon
MTEDWSMLSWDRTPVLIFDTETTGLSSEDRICEIALVVARGHEILERFSTRLNPGRPIGPGASAVHGITDADVANAPQFHEIQDTILSFFSRDMPWVSHNLSFDARMLSYAWPSSKWPRGVPTLCTLNHARKQRLRAGSGRHKLADLANVFAVDYDPAQLHGATYDTEVLAQVTARMMGGAPIGSTMTRFSHEWIVVPKARATAKTNER